ncbi:charged multivesicular body protein 2b [Cimex lectularius]|uniref:Vacuolar assembly/sorting protein DID4 n=1 Tax=Cimex lectularius TaxID=79782 RepID=A0A8I6RTA7_CIMLE|nr:charged multivesicular body protein 2b [Cimex lectularius]
MDWFFNKQPTLKEQQRANEKNLRKASRDVEREKREIEREEKKLELEIKKAAKDGNTAACKILAKQLVQLRKQKNQSLNFNSKIQGISSQNRMMGVNAKLSDAVSTTAATMKNINAVIKPEKMAADIRAFQNASMKIDMSEEMINDTLDDILNESGDEEECDMYVNKVLDEIGIEIAGKVATAPSAGTSSLKSERLPTAEELEEKMAKLRH